MAVVAVAQALRDGWVRWGKPGLIRVDNGYPWGSAGDLPTDLALWVIGLGIDMWWNPPRRPQDNGVVERSQGTAKRWGEPQTASSVEELQERLDRLDELHRSKYPYREKQSRMEWYPGLLHSGRGYSPEEETHNWDWQRVAEHLRGYSVARQVDQKGQISIYNRNHYVGKKHGRAEVWVTFNAEACQWVVSQEDGRILKEIAALELSRERILAFQVTHRR